MKKVAIVTIQSMNYGNRLQNYALSKYLSKYCLCDTLYSGSTGESAIKRVKKIIRSIRCRDKIDLFAKFNLKIPYSKYIVRHENNNTLVDYYDYFIAGSDQIWNPYFKFIGEREFLTFAKADQKISYAASIGLDELPKEYFDLFRERLKDFKAISVRETAAAGIIRELLGRDVPVVLDPTLLLERKEWEKIERKSKLQPSAPYIFKYILGIENEQYNQWIQKIADENGWEIFELRDADKYDNYAVGPSEFISLIHNSELICTDSFHGTVFSLLYEKKFIVFERPSQKGFGQMSSRFDTLLGLTKTERCRIKSDEDLKQFTFEFDNDYVEIGKVLNLERDKSDQFLKKALDLNL